MSDVKLIAGSNRVVKLARKGQTLVDISGEGLGPITYSEPQDRQVDIIRGVQTVTKLPRWRPVCVIPVLDTATVQSAIQFMALNGRLIDIEIQAGDGNKLTATGLAQIQWSVEEARRFFTIDLMLDGRFTSAAV